MRPAHRTERSGGFVRRPQCGHGFFGTYMARMQRMRRFAERAALALFAAAFVSAVFFFIVPMTAVFFPLFGGGLLPAHTGGAAWAKIFRIFVFTVTQAALSSALACLIGTAAAFFCAKRKFFGRRLLLSLSGVPLCVPAIITALSYILFFGNNGMLNAALKRLLRTNAPPLCFLYSIRAVILCQSFYNFPIAMQTVSKAWAEINPDEEDAAVILGGSRARIFRTITLPSLAPSIAVSFLLIFLFCFFSFVIVLLFGGLGISVLETELYRAVRSTFDMQAAARIAFVGTGTAALVIFSYARIRLRFQNNRSALKTQRRRPAISGAGERTAFCILCVLIALFLVLPLLSLFSSSFFRARAAYGAHKNLSLSAWERVFSSRIFVASFLQTVRTAMGTAMLSTAAALFFAYIEFVKMRIPLKNALPFFPLAVSSVVFGFGWNLVPHPNASVLLVFAECALFWPFAWTQIQNYASRIPDHLIEAALLVSDTKTAVFFRLFIPLCRKGIVQAAAFTFAMSAGDASLPLVLHLSGFSNLSLLLFGYASSYRFAESAVVAFVLVALSGGVLERG